MNSQPPLAAQAVALTEPEAVLVARQLHREIQAFVDKHPNAFYLVLSEGQINTLSPVVIFTEEYPKWGNLFVILEPSGLLETPYVTYSMYEQTS